MAVDPKIRKITIEGHGSKRILICPYCKKSVKVSLVGHLRRDHSVEWDEWTNEFVAIYNRTNDLKRVMREFRNSDGELVLSWTVIDREIKRKVESGAKQVSFLKKPRSPAWDPTGTEYSRFKTTVWDIPRRGSWGVHQSTYRGNWPPQVARAIIETYSQPGAMVIDPFVGGGTTLLEAWVLGRNACGFDISEFALEMTRSRLDELRTKASATLFGLPDVGVVARRGDARIMPGIKGGSVDLVCTHPPYADALKYSHDDPADLSHIDEPEVFLDQLRVVGVRAFHVLKPDGVCALLIGDLRRNGVLHCLGIGTVERFRSIGFRVEDIIIKTQNQDRSTEFYYKNPDMRFRLNHEYLLVFRKPRKELA